MVLLRYLFASLGAVIGVVNAQAQAPTVKLKSKATIIGSHNAATGLDEFLGIPYAQPPLGQLRYAAPAPLVQNASTVVQAASYSKVCWQPPAPAPYYNTSQMSEDCLTVNVFRPVGVKSTNLPVMVWIYGGSYFQGGASIYNGSALVQRSVQLNEPVIYVSFNYRLNSFGFLASSEVATAASHGTASLNVGLYDIQAAFQWVQTNIAAFGGDPKKVTAFGQSAGAISIGSMLVANRGQAVSKLGLFRGAIMESGAPAGDPVPPPSYLDPQYEAFAAAAGCSANGTALACLRTIPADVLADATLSVIPTTNLAFPFNRVVDGYWFDTQPSGQVREKAVAHVPLMMGNNLDEGTVFTQPVDNATELESVLETTFYQNTNAKFSVASLIPTLYSLYPDNPALGSPYAPPDVSPYDRLYPPATTQQYKRFASILGDSIFHAPRRFLLSAYEAAGGSQYPVWNYLFVQNTPGAGPAYGVYHTSEIPFVFGEYAASNASSPEGQTSLFMMDSWLKFANTLSPNGPSLPNWPKYGLSRTTMRIGMPTNATSNAITALITDTYREKGIAFLGSEAWTSASFI
ncbi:alpha/beta-hydrolase [Clavulina sp. PMI_390]|nr:alpha/beta-hydrolase [Clavulina sp. PMI_390]